MQSKLDIAVYVAAIGLGAFTMVWPDPIRRVFQDWRPFAWAMRGYDPPQVNPFFRVAGAAIVVACALAIFKL